MKQHIRPASLTAYNCFLTIVLVAELCAVGAAANDDILTTSSLEFNWPAVTYREIVSNTAYYGKQVDTEVLVVVETPSAGPQLGIKTGLEEGDPVYEIDFSGGGWAEFAAYLSNELVEYDVHWFDEQKVLAFIKPGFEADGEWTLNRPVVTTLSAVDACHISGGPKAGWESEEVTVRFGTQRAVLYDFLRGQRALLLQREHSAAMEYGTYFVVYPSSNGECQITRRFGRSAEEKRQIIEEFLETRDPANYVSPPPGARW